MVGLNREGKGREGEGGNLKRVGGFGRKSAEFFKFRRKRAGE